VAGIPAAFHRAEEVSGLREAGNPDGRGQGAEGSPSLRKGNEMETIAFPFESQKRLLRLSRQTLESFVHRVRPSHEEVQDPYLLSTLYGSFVSLHKGDELRGCVGTCVATSPLFRTVIEMTEAAASQDHRFSPVAESEIPEIKIAISILSPLKPVDDFSALEVGQHGLHVARGDRRGVLLPQVATEYGWDMETFLQQACMKAGLNEGAWRSTDTRISSFTSVLIEEGL